MRQFLRILGGMGRQWCRVEHEMTTLSSLLTAEELSNLLRVRPATIRIWTRKGIIPAIRVTRKVIRYDRREVEQALRRRAATREEGPDRRG